MYNQEKSTSPVANDEEHFQYDFGVTAIFYILSLASAALAIALFFQLIGRVVGYISGNEQSLAGALDAVGYIVLLIFYSLVISSAYPSFRVSDSGLTVQVFLFWRVFVPWNEVRTVRATVLGTSKLVVLQSLTPIHRVYGLIFGFTVLPAFVIRRRINGYDRAVKAIEMEIAKK